MRALPVSLEVMVVVTLVVPVKGPRASLPKSVPMLVSVSVAELVKVPETALPDAKLVLTGPAATKVQFP